MPQNIRRLFMNRRFLLFFISQNLINCGAIIQIVAIARLIVDMTSSGLLTGFSIICAPVPGVLLSLVAGSIGDRFQAKKLLIFFDIMRGCFTLLFIFCKTASSVFAVMILISTFDVLYCPSKNKVLTSIMGSENLLDGNSLLSGGYGAVSMVTPLLIGLFIGSFGVKSAFIVCSLMYFLSSALLSGVNIKSRQIENMGTDRRSYIFDGIRYCFKTPPLRRAILTTAFMDFGTICVNIAFYSLAFDTMNVTSAYWGFLLSVLYGMNLFSMMILIRFRKYFSGNSLIIPQFLLIGVSFVWYFYSVARNSLYLLIGVASEGLCISICNTLLMTCILENARKYCTARVVGVKDLASNISKLLGIAYTYLFLKFLGVSGIFISCSLIIFTYAAVQLVLTCRTTPDRRRREP